MSNIGNANHAAEYGVSIQLASPIGGALWRIIDVHHMTPAENHGQHNLFALVIDEQGARVTNPDLRLLFTWQGRRNDEPAPPAPLTKTGERYMADVPIFPGQILSAWIGGDGISSDVVDGLSTNHPSDGDGNSPGHHSYEVTWQRQQFDAPQPEPPVPPIEPPPDHDSIKNIDLELTATTSIRLITHGYSYMLFASESEAQG